MPTATTTAAPQPIEGGSYQRHPITGELVPLQQPQAAEPKLGAEPPADQAPAIPAAAQPATTAATNSDEA